ncbi:hypothetical protein EJ06DRAFT_341913 [Trichodelitschia bisporula]|uniref:Uncharacterized protein n=1 Tax=Trichodelitschia bisporula TaxID=703511 RepID=A0A6G1I2T4_9PEZI|nr:hypothetical protein EJ06DRAFT_341913 [Trichodelitschia bisporula]
MYKRVASTICPLAPFLVPRSAAVCLRNIHQVPVRSFAARSNPKSRPRPNRDGAYAARVDSKHARELSRLRDALYEGKWNTVEALYPTFKEHLSPIQTLRLTNLVHSRLRNLRPEWSDTAPLLQFVDDIVLDLQAGKIAPHPKAYLHLLSIYKESRQYIKGRELWQWLEAQDENSCDAWVYGGALELLVYDGEPLEKLEKIYSQALLRFSGENFTDYHLSPTAILPDRGQPLVVKGIPLALLQGIFTARVLSGDWRNAYLAFDTALRLYPDRTPTRFFELIVYERPLAEAVMAFSLSCASRPALPPKMLTYLLNRLVDKQSGRFNVTKIAQNLKIFELMLDAIRAYVATGGILDTRYVSLLVTALSNMVTWVPPSETRHSALQRYNQQIARIAERIIESFSKYVAGPVSTAYTALAALGGKVGDGDFAFHAIERFGEVGGVPTEITYRTMVSAAGYQGDAEGLQAAWKVVVNHASRHKRQLGITDWNTLSRAVRMLQSGETDAFLEAQLEILDAPDGIREVVRSKSKRPVFDIDPSLVSFDFSQITHRLTSLINTTEAQIGLMLADPATAVNREDFHSNDMLKPLSPSSSPEPMEALKAVYDRLTTDPGQPPSGAVAIDAAGIPFDEHRFQNWLAVNKILAMAESNSQLKNAAIDYAFQSGRAVRDPETTEVFLENLEGNWLQAPVEARSRVITGGEEHKNDLQYEHVRDRVLSLRGLAV